MATKSTMQLEALRNTIENRKHATKSVCDMLVKLSQDGYVRTGHYTGSGRHTKAVDQTQEVVMSLKRLQISHAEGNDAPRGGVAGNYVVLTSEALMKLIGKTDTYRQMRKQAGSEWKYIVQKPYTDKELLELARQKVDWVTDEYKDDPDGRYWLNVYHGAEVYELIIRHGRIVGSICEGFHPTIPRADNRISPSRERWIDALKEVICERVGSDWHFAKADGSGAAFFLREAPQDEELQKYVKEYTVPSMDWRDGGYHTNYEIKGTEQKPRYLLQPSEQQSDGWVCTDTENGIVCRFQAHRFNETSKMTFLEDVPQPDALQIARLMREMGDWLAEHHGDILF